MRLLLTDRFCARAKSPSAQTDYFDETVSGLALRVSKHGVKTWTFIYTTASGKRSRMTLGRYPTISLANARALALEAREAAAAGLDPRHRADAMTVTGLVESYVEKHAAGLRTADEIKRRLHRNIVPVIGNVKLADLHRRDATSRPLQPI